MQPSNRPLCIDLFAGAGGLSLGFEQAGFDIAAAVGKHKQFLQEIIETFAEIGYQVLLPYQVLNAADFGVPQDRRRLFLIGARVGQILPEYPIPLSGSLRMEARQDNRTTVWEAIGDLPDADKFPELIDRDWVKTEFLDGSDYARKMRQLLNDPEDYSYLREFDRQILTSSLRTEHTKKIKQRFADTPLGKTESISRFLKLNPDGLCNTLRAGTGSDRGAHTSPRPIHPYLARCITVREAARLHSYPDWFRFHVTKWHGCRQIGNSVPPLLARAVAKQIIQAVGVKQHKPSHKIKLEDERLLSLKMSEAATKFQVAANVIPQRTQTLLD